ncbi:MAG: amidophosphoribosyltransferase [Candidatus Omnitrophota bacterium]
MECKEKCGLFGMFGTKEAASLTFLGLYALQHRGQESAGIVVSDGKEIRSHLGMGEVSKVFSPDILKNLSGHIAVGHTRYSTTGGSNLKNAQPFLANYYDGVIAVGHNGNLTNTRTLRERLENRGALFHSTTDSELVIHLISHSSTKTFPENLIEALGQIEGAYCLLILMKDKLIAARDPSGFRPLCLGTINGGYAVASETSALDIVEAEYLREVEPGEIVVLSEKGLESFKPFPNRKHAFCIFEYIYFARPDSKIFGHSVYLTRKRLGQKLAQEAPVAGDFVMPVPDSGTYAALGFSAETGLPFEMAFVRNHYVGRTFIQPVQKVRDLGVKIKLNPVRELIDGKRIILVEDSIVRGTTSQSRVRTLRNFGAQEVHMRVSCPPHRFPCYYGIDFPTPKELAANRYTTEEIKKYLNLDSLHYLSYEGMMSGMPLPAEEFCTACFNGSYPVVPEEGLSKEVLERR